MTEEEKDQSAKGQGAGENDDSAKGDAVSQEEFEKLKAENEKLREHTRHQESLLGKQSTDVGELRQQLKENQAKIEELTHSKRSTDKLFEDTVAEYIQDGQTEEQARYNAKLVITGVKKAQALEAEQRKAEQAEKAKAENERIASDALDRLEEAFEDGKIDEKVYREHEKEIMAEYRRLKNPKTAREMYKNIRDSYVTVKKRKAEEMRGKKGAEGEDNRNTEIDEQNLAITKKAKKEAEDADAKARTAIQDAGGGGLRGSAFE